MKIVLGTGVLPARGETDREGSVGLGAVKRRGPARTARFSRCPFRAPVSLATLGEPPGPRRYLSSSLGAMAGNGKIDGAIGSMPLPDHGVAVSKLDQACDDYANVGLQLFLPLGPRLAVFGFDKKAYVPQTGVEGLITVDDDAHVRLINDLQWEAAHSVLLVPSDISEEVLRASAFDWSGGRRGERTIVLEEIVYQSDSEARTRYGSGEAPSTVQLDLPFVTCRLPKPTRLAPWEVPAFHDPERVARVDRAFKGM